MTETVRQKVSRGIIKGWSANGKVGVYTDLTDAVMEALGGDDIQIVPDVVIILTLVDSNGNAVRVGDRVRFSYLRYFNDAEADTGYPGTEPEEMQGEGIVQFSPYSGAYIVRNGRSYPIGRKRWFEVLP